MFDKFCWRSLWLKKRVYMEVNKILLLIDVCILACARYSFIFHKVIIIPILFFKNYDFDFNFNF